MEQDNVFIRVYIPGIECTVRELQADTCPLSGRRRRTGNQFPFPKFNAAEDNTTGIAGIYGQSIVIITLSVSTERFEAGTSAKGERCPGSTAINAQVNTLQGSRAAFGNGSINIVWVAWCNSEFRTACSLGKTGTVCSNIGKCTYVAGRRSIRLVTDRSTYKTVGSYIHIFCSRQERVTVNDYRVGPGSAAVISHHQAAVGCSIHTVVVVRVGDHFVHAGPLARNAVGVRYSSCQAAERSAVIARFPDSAADQTTGAGSEQVIQAFTGSEIDFSALRAADGGNTDIPESSQLRMLRPVGSGVVRHPEATGNTSCEHMVRVVFINPQGAGTATDVVGTDFVHGNSSCAAAAVLTEHILCFKGLLRGNHSGFIQYTGGILLNIEEPFGRSANPLDLLRLGGSLFLRRRIHRLAAE
ncbi:MAG: hypothetical protein FD123_3967 [Bacteroidetes bacterium]|nr:MAG: hypothetical protein FD123_3967 [Bacteroidota bacterium]